MESLIEEVKKHPALYDHRDDKFHDKQHKNNIWAQIATTLSYSNGADAEEEWEKLVQKFRDTVEQQEVNTGIDKPVGIKWKHFQIMEFLLPFLVKKVESDEELTKLSVVNTDPGDQSTNNDKENQFAKDSPAQGETVNQIKIEEMDTDNIKEEIDSDETEVKAMYSEDIQTEVKVEETELAISDIMTVVPDDELTSFLRCEDAELDAIDNNETSFDEDEDDDEDDSDEEVESEDEDNETENNQAYASLYHFFMSTYATTKTMPENLQMRVIDKIVEALTETGAIVDGSSLGENFRSNNAG